MLSVVGVKRSPYLLGVRLCAGSTAVKHTPHPTITLTLAGCMYITAVVLAVAMARAACIIRVTRLLRPPPSWAASMIGQRRSKFFNFPAHKIERDLFIHLFIF